MEKKERISKDRKWVKLRVKQAKGLLKKSIPVNALTHQERTTLSMAIDNLEEILERFDYSSQLF